MVCVSEMQTVVFLCLGNFYAFLFVPSHRAIKIFALLEENHLVIFIGFFLEQNRIAIGDLYHCCSFYANSETTPIQFKGTPLSK